MENINTCLTALLNNYMRQCMETAPSPGQLSRHSMCALCLGGGVKGAESPCPCDKLHVGWEHSEEVRCSGRDWPLAAFGRGSWVGVRAVRPVFSVTVVITSGFRCFRNIQIFTWRHPRFSSQSASTLWLLGWESSCLWPKAYSEGPSVSFIEWFAASYTGSCVFNKKHFCISKIGYIFIALNIPKER